MAECINCGPKPGSISDLSDSFNFDMFCLCASSNAAPWTNKKKEGRKERKKERKKASEVEKTWKSDQIRRYRKEASSALLLLLLLLVVVVVLVLVVVVVVVVLPLFCCYFIRVL